MNLHFGFEEQIWILIKLIPDHCLASVCWFWYSDHAGAVTTTLLKYFAWHIQTCPVSFIHIFLHIFTWQRIDIGYKVLTNTHYINVSKEQLRT